MTLKDSSQKEWRWGKTKQYSREPVGVDRRVDVWLPVETKRVPLAFTDPNLKERFLYISRYHDWLGSLLNEYVP